MPLRLETQLGVGSGVVTMVGGLLRREHLVIVFLVFSSAVAHCYMAFWDVRTVGVLCYELFVGSVMHLQCCVLLFDLLLY